MSGTFGSRFISAIAAENDIRDWFSYGDLAPLFEDDPVIAKAYAFVDSFARKHGRIPSPATIVEETGLALPPAPGEVPWLHEQLVRRRIRRRLAMAGEEVQVKLKADDALGALGLMYQEVNALTASVRSARTFDFKDASTTLWPWLTEKWSGAKLAMPLPWTTLSAMTGGIYGGELISFVGRPGTGKTWLMLHSALFAWQQMKAPIVFSSQEIKAPKLMERLAAMYTKVPYDLMKDGLSANMFGKEMRQTLKDGLTILENSDMPPFIIVDNGLAATMPEILGVCRRFNPCGCWVDGAYIPKVPGRSFVKGFERIEYNVEFLKGDIATALDIPTVASFQFNREGAKVKKGETPGTEHIAGGDAIGQYSSLVLGLLNVDTQTNNPEHIARRKISIPKGRDGEMGEFQVQWDFQRMDFSEVVESIHEVPMWGLD